MDIRAAILEDLDTIETHAKMFCAEIRSAYPREGILGETRRVESIRRALGRLEFAQRQYRYERESY